MLCYVAAVWHCCTGCVHGTSTYIIIWMFVSQAGMTITFKPSLFLQYSTLLAAMSSQTPVAPILQQHYALCSIPSSAKHAQPQLALWDGCNALCCDLHPGCDPSQRAIDLSVNAKAHFLYGDSKQQLSNQQSDGQGDVDPDDPATPLSRTPAVSGAAASKSFSNMSEGRSTVQIAFPILSSRPSANKDITDGKLRWCSPDLQRFCRICWLQCQPATTFCSLLPSAQSLDIASVTFLGWYNLLVWLRAAVTMLTSLS